MPLLPSAAMHLLNAVSRCAYYIRHGCAYFWATALSGRELACLLIESAALALAWYGF